MTVTIPDQVAQMYRELSGELSQACFRWQIFHQLFGKNKERIELMEATASNFFGELETLLVDGAILQICRMTDPPTQGRFDNLVIDQLHMGLDPARDAPIIQALESKADAIHAMCVDLREHRRKRIAHFDKPTMLGPPNTVLPVLVVKGIGDAFYAIGDYLNCFAGYVYDLQTYYKKILSKSDGELLVHFLKRGIAFDEMERADWTLTQRVDQGPFGNA
jgi:AbiU2